MQDRYLFRAKQIGAGAWVEGGLYQTESAAVIFCYGYAEDGAHNSFIIPVDPCTIGQCTGLEDKNGNLIFEGDIIYSNVAFHVKCGWKNWIVEWDENEYGATGFSIVLIGTTFSQEMCIAHSKYYEIIGNIHDTAPTEKSTCRGESK